MKRKLVLAVVLLLSVGALVWGVNYRLNHPALTPADRQFRARVAGADSAVIRQKKPVGFVKRAAPLAVLDAAQTRALIETLRFVNANSQLDIVSLSPLELTFLRAGQPLARFELYQSDHSSELESLEKPYQVFQLHPRFDKPLRRLLRAALPAPTKP